MKVFCVWASRGGNHAYQGVSSFVPIYSSPQFDDGAGSSMRSSCCCDVCSKSQKLVSF